MNCEKESGADEAWELREFLFRIVGVSEASSSSFQSYGSPFGAAWLLF